MAQTTKTKQKFQGVQYLVDPNTGEAIPFAVSSVEDRDFNFTKTWMRNLITALDDITNKKMTLAFWIIDHLDKENKLTYTQRQMAEMTGISLDTVHTTMKLLQEGEVPFLKRKNQGCYIVNPDVMSKGSHNARMGILYDYSQAAYEDSKRRASSNEPSEDDDTE